MTKEQLEIRIKELEVNRENLKANFLATEGALQDCNYWLSKLEETPTTVEKKKK